jgi:hypothetical protein
VVPLTAAALERKLCSSNSGTVDEKQPLQSVESMVIFSIGDVDDQEATEQEPLCELQEDSGKKAAELTVSKAGEKGRLPSQTTAAQRREDTRP